MIYGFSLAILTTLISMSEAHASPSDPRTISVQSRATGETSIVRIWTPDGYDRSDDRYPVIYCADHNPTSDGAAEILAKLAERAEAPKLILVGVLSNAPRRDFTPTACQDYGPTSGGGDTWLNHVQSEVIPRIESEFRTSSQRIWWGHSIVGALGLHGALNRPDLFQAFIISSPWLIYDDPNRFLIESAERVAAERRLPVRPMYLAVGNEPNLRPIIDEFVSIVTPETQAPFALTFEHLEGEDHGSIAPVAFEAGLKTIFGPAPNAMNKPPTGRIVFYSQRDGQAEIYRVNPDATGLTRLTHNDADDICPAWSPDASRIVFASDRGGSMDIYTMDADGGDVVRVTRAPGQEGAPYFSSDGSQIIYRFTDEDGAAIYVCDADGANPTRLPTQSTEFNCPSWSPDASTILYNASDEHDLYRTYLMDADGTNPRRLTTLRSEEMFPRFSPDGSQVVFGTIDRQTLTARIYIADADGSNIRSLTPPGARCEDPMWSPDGRHIVFHSNDDGNFSYQESRRGLCVPTRRAAWRGQNR